MTDTTATDSATESASGTTPESVPADPLDGGERRRPSRWNYVGLGLLALVVIAAIVASVVQLPYYRISPGSVYDTIERVSAPTEEIEIPEGDIGFVTVSQTADISAWQWVAANFDGDAVIKHEDEINGDRTTEEKREQDQRRMQVSKNAAVVVALDRLGHDLIITPLGIEVASVFECSAADGLLNTGDLIVGMNGQDVLETEVLVDSLGELSVGDEIELLVERIDPNNSARSISIELVDLTVGSRSDSCLPDDVREDTPRAFIGIGTAQMVDEALPFDVDIDTGRVGGPSAGLAFTLAIIDVLSEGELTNGMNIVATGTIDRDGNVGPVGGVHQKTVAAEQSGADLFIVPACCDNFVNSDTGEPIDQPSNYEEALEHADEMIVVGVNNLDDALGAIAELGGDVEGFLSEDTHAVD